MSSPEHEPVLPDLTRPTSELRSEAGPYFGDFGGRFLPEALVPALDELTEVYEKAIIDPEFTRAAPTRRRIHRATVPAVRGPALLAARRRRRILLKREDLNHTGSHKINNVLGQALLTSAWARRV